MKTLQRNEIKEVNQPRGKSQVKDESQVQFLFDVSKVKDYLIFCIKIVR